MQRAKVIPISKKMPNVLVKVVFPYDLRAGFDAKVDDALRISNNSGRSWIVFLNQAGTLAHCIKADASEYCLVRFAHLNLKSASAKYITNLMGKKIERAFY